MGNCRDCVHADPGIIIGEDGLPLEEQATFNGLRVYECKRTRMSYRDREDAESLAVAQDASGYHACLEVLETFGCVQFEAKP